MLIIAYSVYSRHLLSRERPACQGKYTRRFFNSSAK